MSLFNKVGGPTGPNFKPDKEDSSNIKANPSSLPNVSNKEKIEEGNKVNSMSLISTDQGSMIFRADSSPHALDSENSLSVAKAFHIQGPYSQKSVATWEVAQALGDPFTQVILPAQIESYAGQIGVRMEPPNLKVSLSNPAESSIEQRFKALELDNNIQSLINKIQGWDAEGLPLGPANEVAKLSALAGGPVRKIHGEYCTLQSDTFEQDPILIEQLVALQIMDFICGQVDRPRTNYYIQYDSINQKVMGVKALDNDYSFGEEDYALDNVQQLIEKGYQGVTLPPIISEKMYESIMNLNAERLKVILGPYISDQAWECTQNRVQLLQKHVATLKLEGKVIQQEDWGHPNIEQLLRVKSEDLDVLPSSYYGRDIQYLKVG